MKLDECKGVMFDFYITLFCFLSWYPIIDEQSLSILYIAVIIKFSVIEFIKRNNIPIFIIMLKANTYKNSTHCSFSD